MKKIIELIRGNLSNYTPIWMMRQAGRYLPEYRETRKQVNNFLEMCYTPELATKVTLQPIDRFDFDTAIIFSDILVIPDALGVDVNFIEGQGPLLTNKYPIKDLKLNLSKLAPVYEAISQTRALLSDDKALIGFAGAPWTLAAYIIEGKSSKDFQKSRLFMLNNPQEFALLINLLENAISEHLINQIKAGADIVKIFDSWSGLLNPYEFKKWVIEPTKRIIAQIRNSYPTVPIIAFPKGAGLMYQDYIKETKADVIAIDQYLPIEWASHNLAIDNAVLQGNLDPLYLLCEDQEILKREVLRIKNSMNRPYIFNLGHGILPSTSIENVKLMIDLVRRGLTV